MNSQWLNTFCVFLALVQWLCIDRNCSALHRHRFFIRVNEIISRNTVRAWVNRKLIIISGSLQQLTWNSSKAMGFILITLLIIIDLVISLGHDKLVHPQVRSKNNNHSIYMRQFIVDKDIVYGLITFSKIQINSSKSRINLHQLFLVWSKWYIGLIRLMCVRRPLIWLERQYLAVEVILPGSVPNQLPQHGFFLRYGVIKFRHRKP